MARAPFQVLIIPYRRRQDGTVEYAVTKRADMDAWQFLSGGAENSETPLEAAKREAQEEGDIPADLDFMALDATASIPANNFGAWKEWGEGVYVVPEHCFAVDMQERELQLSFEHSEVRWLGFDNASKLLTWDSNRIAMWELKERLNE
jgi:dATP pyrophosphohydrolase